ncbi:hypothetical protein IMSAGC013_02908 [Lachnospiraceae bacterium]|nr:hypothetical protein IMSAGC013_02908 [Lachnospiraceae bacterium]
MKKVVYNDCQEVVRDLTNGQETPIGKTIRER